MYTLAIQRYRDMTDLVAIEINAQISFLLRKLNQRNYPYEMQRETKRRYTTNLTGCVDAIIPS